MPAYALLVACLGLLAARLARARRPLWRLLAFAALLALVIWRGATSYPDANNRGRAEEDGLAPAWAIVADNPPHGSAVYGTLFDSTALDYVTRIWGVRPDLHAVTIEQARDVLDGGGRVAVTAQALPIVQAQVAGALHYSALGGALVLAAREPLPPPSGLHPWQATISPALQLAGGSLRRNEATHEITVLLLWLATAPVDRDLSVSVRLLSGGDEIAQVDRSHPVNGAFPTGKWRAGEQVADAYPFRPVAGREPDAVRVIVYYRNESGGFVNVNEATFRVEQAAKK